MESDCLGLAPAGHLGESAHGPFALRAESLVPFHAQGSGHINAGKTLLSDKMLQESCKKQQKLPTTRSASEFSDGGEPAELWRFHEMTKGNKRKAGAIMSNKREAHIDHLVMHSRCNLPCGCFCRKWRPQGESISSASILCFFPAWSLLKSLNKSTENDPKMNAADSDSDR